jgi:Cu+-exporting ATPase
MNPDPVHAHGTHSDAPPPSGISPDALKDPVCGMTVTAASPHVLQHQGTPIYFCSAGCKAKFTADPAKYQPVPGPLPPVPPIPAASGPVAAGTLYTCPMHPEVRQDHPGACPKCGMALEPELPSLDEADSPELVDFRRRFYWTLPLTVIVTVLAMAGHRLQWRIS